MVDLSTILEALSGASTIAVILGVPFILLQMRQNTRMIDAANRQAELVASQNRAQLFLSISERITDHRFILQRKEVRDIVAKYAKQGWDGFVNSADGFEIRSLAMQYESVALMVKLGLVDEETVAETLGLNVLIDWRAIQPAVAEFGKAWTGAKVFPNFHHMAEVAERYWSQRGISAGAPGGGDPLGGAAGGPRQAT